MSEHCMICRGAWWTMWVAQRWHFNGAKRFRACPWYGPARRLAGLQFLEPFMKVMPSTPPPSPPPLPPPPSPPLRPALHLPSKHLRLACAPLICIVAWLGVKMRDFTYAGMTKEVLNHHPCLPAIHGISVSFLCVLPHRQYVRQQTTGRLRHNSARCIALLSFLIHPDRTGI